jgi:hypothetical protein
MKFLFVIILSFGGYNVITKLLLWNKPEHWSIKIH